MDGTQQQTKPYFHMNILSTFNAFIDTTPKNKKKLLGGEERAQRRQRSAIRSLQKKEQSTYPDWQQFQVVEPVNEVEEIF